MAVLVALELGTALFAGEPWVRRTSRPDGVISVKVAASLDEVLV